jgi:hypothetical protein
MNNPNPNPNIEGERKEIDEVLVWNQIKVEKVKP